MQAHAYLGAASRAQGPLEDSITVTIPWIQKERFYLARRLLNFTASKVDYDDFDVFSH
jgi:hypothetical protein